MSDEPHNLSQSDLGGLTPPARRDPLAEALASLTPAAPELNRDRLMFEAGAASRANVIRLWQLTAGLLAAFGFAAGLMSRPPKVVERYVPVERAISPVPADAPPSGTK